MDNQQLISYIQQQQSQGVSKEIITASLICLGWKLTDIEEAFAKANTPASVNGILPTAAGVITENTYPIEQKWIIKTVIGETLASLLIFLFIIFGMNNWEINFKMGVYLLLIPLGAVISYLRRKMFHYTIDNNFLSLQQGILSKQQRHIPYGVIQNVYVKQDLFDRFFGLASLSLENAAGSGGQSKIFGIPVKNSGSKQSEMIGFSGNRVSIPGLSKQNAETLKGILLQKIKENPLADNQSGL